MQKLDRMQAELAARNQQNIKDSKKFFKDLFTESKQMLLNNKYKPAAPADENDLDWSPNPIIDHLPLYQQSPRLPTTSNFESEFLLEKVRLRETEMKIPVEIPNLNTMSDEVDILLKQFENI